MPPTGNVFVCDVGTRPGRSFVFADRLRVTITHRLVLRGIRLGAIQGNVPELHHPSWPAEFQDLHKQIGHRRQVKRPLTARQREVCSY